MIREKEMAVINVLSRETIDKIAAGEVVERPSSVVKELLENAIDAGAGAITVEVKDGGISLIRVTDNGSGIEKTEIAKAFLRHATSKILSADDLNGVESLGFRGEALSSIAAVSRMELISKTREELTGIRYRIEGGEEKELEEIGAPDGTTVLVRNLFYNVPVRKKFLKQPQTEGGYISDLLEHMALSHPEISFTYINQGQTRFHTSGNRDLKEIIYRIYGRDIAGALLPVDVEEQGIRMYGFLGKPEINRANRNYEIYFVNGRFIKSGVIGKAIDEGYRSYVMQHKFPFVVLHFEIDGKEMDVNVHPTKMEVRFTHQKKLYDFIAGHITAVLKSTELIPQIRLDEKGAQKQRSEAAQTAVVPEPFEVHRRGQEAGGRTAAGSERGADPAILSESKTVQHHGMISEDKAVPDPGIVCSDNTVSDPAKIAECKRMEDHKNKSEDRAAADPKMVSDEAATLDHPGLSEDTAGQELFFEDLRFPVPPVVQEEAGFSKTPKAAKVIGLETPAGSEEDGRHAVLRKDAEGQSTAVSGNPISAGACSGREDSVPAADMVPPKPSESEETEAHRQWEPDGIPQQLNLFEEKLLSEENRQQYQILGQIFGTYWLLTFQNKLFIMDQHAAHEKVKYETLLKRMRTRRVEVQMLHPPVILTLSSREEHTLQEHWRIFEELGFEIEDFGGREYALRGVPVDLYGTSSKTMFLEILDEMSAGTLRGAPELIRQKAASMACKAAVKGNMQFDQAGISALFDQLLELEDPYHCPHGRPTIISMSRYEIERKFKRIV